MPAGTDQIARRKILIVEDDQNLARILRDNLSFDGYTVECVGDGNAAIDAVQSFIPDLVLLDITLPGRDGFDLCPLMRQHGRTPVIILTARSQKADKLRGLDLGADDYITKPFDLEEMLARVRAVLRRTRPSVERIVLGDVVIDFERQCAMRNAVDLRLTHRELEVLHYLAERHDRAVRRDELLHELWGYALTPTTRSVDLTIARLRKKIEIDPHRPQFIRTAHGDGYCLTLQSPA